MAIGYEEPFGTAFVQSWYYVEDTHRVKVLGSQ